MILLLLNYSNGLDRNKILNKLNICYCFSKKRLAADHKQEY